MPTNGGHEGRGTATIAPGRRHALVLVAVAWVVLAMTPAAPTDVVAVLCAGRPATIVGTSSDDTIRGTAGDDVLRGGAGGDNLSGGDGADRMRGGDGDDSLSGGPGADRLTGGEGADLLQGDDDDTPDDGHGPDRLFGGVGDDYLSGDGGDDTLRGEDGTDRCHGGKGQDAAASCEAVAATESGQSARPLLEPGPGLVALTFDDGPSGLYGGRLLDILARYRVPATFFVVGERAEARPDLVRPWSLGGTRCRTTPTPTIG